MASTTLDLSRELPDGLSRFSVSGCEAELDPRESSFFFQTMEFEREEKIRTEPAKPESDFRIPCRHSLLKISILWNDFRLFP